MHYILEIHTQLQCLHHIHIVDGVFMQHQLYNMDVIIHDMLICVVYIPIFCSCLHAIDFNTYLQSS